MVQRLRFYWIYLALTVLWSGLSCDLFSQDIPLPEHPNPIKYRQQWKNLNGQWAFAFDSLDIGVKDSWFSKGEDFDREISVPFPWGSELSGQKDEADIGWYHRTIRIPESWRSKRTFIIIGAADWKTDLFINGHKMGSHEGGYVPFEFDITDHIEYNEDVDLVIRVDDVRRPHTLYGKQGYGNARGIWQTVFLEARGEDFINDLHVTPNIDSSRIEVTAYVNEPSEEGEEIFVTVGDTESFVIDTIRFAKGQTKATVEIDVPDQRLWSLDDPHLYGISATYHDDKLESYFGMRKISVMNLPRTDIPYVALNNQPIYLQMALDQSYHPKGFYTFPSEQFIIDEIKRSKSIGLNGIRTHIKVEVPRKLFWADKLGLLVMEDLPNSWGEPEELMQKESTYTLREMIKRDYNHPSVFSWVIMNETWGLFTSTAEGREYLPETQRWVESLYHLAKSLDPSRLIEDNSICCGKGHTVTDLNSWHVYLPGYEWDQYLADLSDSTYVGSRFHYEAGYQQGTEPNFNSECGNVWGYEGSTGDVDWSWDYHRMMNSFRKYPTVAGWLYTEHHDVINEWNGYWRFDRTKKFTGMEDIMPGMTINDLHSAVYLSTGQDICHSVKAGASIKIPLHISAMTSKAYGLLSISYDLSHVNRIGEKETGLQAGKRMIPYQPWMQESLDSLTIAVPESAGLSTISLTVRSVKGEILHRNFVNLVVDGPTEIENTVILKQSPDEYSDSNWSKKVWDVMDGKKVNGAGLGYFEYKIPVSKTDLDKAKEVFFLAEISAKELFVKDMKSYNQNQDFMKGSKVAPSSNPNSYPMTDEYQYASQLQVKINEKIVSSVVLPDDPADHRGILSWHAQLEDRKLREAGSYGYIIKILLDKERRKDIMDKGYMNVKLESLNGGGLAIYGRDFGRYPFDLSLVIKK